MSLSKSLGALRAKCLILAIAGLLVGTVSPTAAFAQQVPSSPSPVAVTLDGPSTALVVVDVTSQMLGLAQWVT